MAEGNYYLMRREEFTSKFPDVAANDAGISNMTVLGIEAVGTYIDSERSGGDEPKSDLADELSEKYVMLKRVREAGTNGEYVREAIPGYESLFPRKVFRESELLAEIAEIEGNPELPYSQQCREARDWFMESAEQLYCWT